MLSGSASLMVQVVSTVVLARLLMPRDFGLVALVSTFSLLLMNFGQNGFTEAILQRTEIDHFLISNLFWINFGIGTASHDRLRCDWAPPGIAVSRPAGAHCYSRSFPDHLPIEPFGSAHSALLRKAMRFPVVSGNDVFSRVVSVVLAVVLARHGWGYRALIAGLVGQTLTQSLGLWYLCRWIPALPRRVAGTRSMVTFAMNIYGRFGLNYFSRNVDNLLVGWRFGATALGFYKKAYDLFALSAGQLSAPLTNVAVAALSRFDPRSQEYRQNLMAAFNIMALVGMGLSGAVTLVGSDLINLLLGPKWERTGRFFTYFGPGVGAVVLYYLHGWIHLSIGRADRWLRWGMIECVVTFLCFLLALPWGPAGIAVAWTTSLWLLMIPAFWYALKPTRITVTSMIATIWKFIAAALVAVLMVSWIGRTIQSEGWLYGSHNLLLLLRIVATMLLYGIIYGLLVLGLHGRWPTLPELRGVSRQITATHPPSDALSSASATSVKRSGEGPLVSILVPAYNAEAWIASSLRSALAQSWEPKEIIVVDDGSTDRTLAVAKQFESDMVRVVAQKNLGAENCCEKSWRFRLSQRRVHSSGWMRTICWLRIKSPGKWQSPSNVKTTGSS